MKWLKLDATKITKKHENVLNERVDCAIAHQDSIVDFRKIGNRYSEIKRAQLISLHEKDSIKTHQITEFRTIHTFEKYPYLLQ